MSPLQALKDRKAKRKIILWVSGTRLPPGKLINYTICD
jgi:hypothetical protein